MSTSPPADNVKFVVSAVPSPLRAAALKLVVNLPTGDVRHVLPFTTEVHTLL